MLRVLFIFLIFLVANAIPQTRENYLHFDHLTMEDGLSHDDVFCILQDQQGFMWFGTAHGLNKYDGYSFTVYDRDNTNTPFLTDKYILSMCEDKHGRLWFGSWDGLNFLDLKKNKIFQFKHDPNNPKSLVGNWIKCIYEDSRENIWIGTKDDGLSYLDHALLDFENPDSNLTFINYSYQPDDTTSLVVNNINTICEDSSGYIWIGTQGGGLNRFDPDQKTFKRFCYLKYEGICDPLIRKIWREPDSKINKLWIATQHTLSELNVTKNKTITYPYNPYIHDGFSAIQKINEHTFWLGSPGKGIYILDKNQGSLNRIRGQACNPGSIRHNWITDIYRDKCGRIWIATIGGGIYKYDRYGHKFPLYQIEVESQEGKNICTVNHLIKDRNPDSSLFWLATPENGVVKFNRETGESVSVAGQGTKIRYHCILQDPDQPEIFWITTWGGALKKVNRETGLGKRFHFHDNFDKVDFHKLQTFMNNANSRQVIKDSKGSIWQTALGGLFQINPKTNDYVVYLPDNNNSKSISSRNVTAILEDRSGQIWVGTFDHGLNCLDPETACFTHYKHDPQNEHTLDQDFIGTLFEDKSGTLWIGTGQILHRLNREQNCIDRYREFPGVIKGILEDDQRNLWISTSKGLSRFNPLLKTIRNYDKNDGLQDNRFILRSAYKSQEGELFFGGQKGFNAFYPDDIVENPHAPPVVLTDFQIFNQSVKPGENSPLVSTISQTSEIFLNYDQSVFSFEFAALDYSATLKNQFAYKMEGVDPEWVYTDSKRRFATYTQLSSGQYIFKVKASNNDGVWNEKGTSVKIIILPPWWRTFWAYSAYIFLFLLSLYALRIYDMKRQRLKQQVILEHDHAEKLREIDHIKSRFFANISHEFRTPLTLILGPIKKWLPQLRNRDLKQDLQMMQRNANRLFRLINQLLDLSRLESGGMTLQARKEDIVQMLRGYIQSFESLARLKKINLEFKAENDSIKVYIDRDKIEKIIYNLLSNAFKFTPEGGEIGITIKIPKSKSQFPIPNSDFIEITITNTGSYIPPEKISHIFDRFYQADNSTIRGHEGSGIGLALTKELVELHHGQITVESAFDKGTTFTVSLPLGQEHFEELEMTHSVPPSSHTFDNELLYEQEAPLGVRPKARKKSPLIMIIEDNPDVRLYIRGHLESSFRIIEAGEGIGGLKLAIKKIPDLIISDVMMPGMDGFELCQKLKTDERTSHIPVILLTARATTEDKINGLETGADDYLTKPFDADELKARIINLIVQRQKLRNHYLKSYKLGSDDKAITQADNLFISKIISITDAHLAEPEYSIESLARDVGFSHSQLIRKLEGLTGLTPSLFIRSRRLLYARQLLNEKAGNISQIAYDCGFNNLSYFARSFKKQFGQLPSDYIKDQH